MADLCPHRVPVTAFCKRCADEKPAAPAKTSALSVDERAALKACEATIRKGLASFLDVGEALLRVRDGRLYRAGYGSFDAYCRERWGFSRRQGSYLIEAAKMGTMVPISNERQARALGPLRDRPEVARDVVDTVARRGKVTARALNAEAKTRVTPLAGVGETGPMVPVCVPRAYAVEVRDWLVASGADGLAAVLAELL